MREPIDVAWEKFKKDHASQFEGQLYSAFLAGWSAHIDVVLARLDEKNGGKK